MSDLHGRALVLPHPFARKVAQLATVTTLLWLATTALLNAQATGYQQPGSQLDRPSDPREDLEEAMLNARWSLGGIKVDPSVGIREATWIDNPLSQNAGSAQDFTITLGAGLRGYIPTGSKVTTVLHVLPEYVWWTDLELRRRLNGRYGAGLYGYFGRASLELSIERNESQEVVTPELQQLINQRNDAGSALLGFQLYRSLELFGEVTRLEIDSLLDDDDPFAPSFAALDRRETSLRGGLQARLGGQLRAAVGIESSQVDFAPALSDRSNEGVSPFLRLAFDAPHVLADATLVAREIKPQRGDNLTPLSDLTGTFSVGFPLENGRMVPRVYGRRNLIYSLTNDFDYLLEEVIGAGFTARFGERWQLRAFLESGQLDYTASRRLELSRTEDTSGYGVELSYRLPGNVTVGLRTNSRRVGSNGGQNESTIQETGLTIRLAPVGWP